MIVSALQQPVQKGKTAYSSYKSEKKQYYGKSARSTYGNPAIKSDKRVKKRVIARYMVTKLVQRGLRAKEEHDSRQDESEKQSAEAVNKATTKIKQYTENAAINTVSGAPYVINQTRKIYAAGRNHVERSRAAQSYAAKANAKIYRTARKYRGANGKTIYRFAYQQADQPSLIRKAAVNKKKFHIAKREQMKRLRQTQETISSDRKLNATYKHKVEKAHRIANGSKIPTGTYYSDPVRRDSLALDRASVTLQSRTQTARTRYGIQQKAASKSNAYQLRAKKAGIRKLQRKQTEELLKSQGNAAAKSLKRGSIKKVGQALSKVTNLAKGKVVVIGAVCVVLCCMVMAPVSLFASAVGILFADENASAMQNANLSTVRQAYADAEAEWYTGVLRGNYDRIDINGTKAKAEDVLAVFSVKLTEFDKLDAMSMDKEQCKVLKKVFNKMNPYTKSYKTEDGERVLKVYISGRTADEGADAFHFKRSHKNIMNELLEGYPNELRNLLYGGGGTGGYPGAPIVGEKYEALMQEAQKYIGYPYVYGGSSPSTSFDCSGYICWVYTHSGVYNLPRTTAWGIYQQCKPVSPSEAQPGDLIFFEKTYQFHEPVTHVGIYVGNGKMLHCGNVRPDRAKVEVD